jgi:hypothetical protein
MKISVLQDWVMELPLRHQGVLCASLRGCDLDAKHSLAKPINRAIRRVVQNPADVRETEDPRAFQHYSSATFPDHVINFSQGMDGYPLHYVMHIVHALQIIGYKHPEKSVRAQFKAAYERLVFKFHLKTEDESELDHRLTYDRYAVNEHVDN